MMLTAVPCNVNTQPIMALNMKIIRVSANVLMHQPRPALSDSHSKKKEVNWNFLTHKAKLLFADFCVLASGNTLLCEGQGFNLTFPDAAYKIDRKPERCRHRPDVHHGPLSVLHAADFNFLIQAQDKGSFG